ncbi:hypothetical protein SMICM17S_09594 [Streptomyces microflavus]
MISVARLNQVDMGHTVAAWADTATAYPSAPHC